MDSFAWLVLKLWKGTLPNQKIYFVTLHYGVFHKILSIITELVCNCLILQNAPKVYNFDRCSYSSRIYIIGACKRNNTMAIFWKFCPKITIRIWTGGCIFILLPKIFVSKSCKIVHGWQILKLKHDSSWMV